jgi:hypothetical protein
MDGRERVMYITVVLHHTALREHFALGLFVTVCNNTNRVLTRASNTLYT